jgi:lipopolysaccharide biosynthesis protein
MSILRKIGSLGYWLMDNEKSLSDFRKKAVWREENLIFEKPSEKIMAPLVITAHVYYPEFASHLIDSLNKLPKEIKVLATTPSQEIKQDLEKYLEKAGNPHDVRLTPNLGRNFGPLLVEFSKELLKEEYFIHVHSKQSLHSPRIAKAWIDRNRSLFLSREGLQRITSITTSNPEVGLVYADASDLLWGINFRWGRSGKVARKLFTHLPGFEKIKWSGHISFPAGGMFLARTHAVRPLLEVGWTYEMFPPEDNQKDGALQHAIERIVGVLASSQKCEHAVLVSKYDQFALISALGEKDDRASRTDT